MQKMIQKLMMSSVSFALTAMTLYSSSTSAAPLSVSDSIPDIPLFLKSVVQPNIMALVDDSGSMDAETLISGADNGYYWPNSPVPAANWTEAMFYSHPSTNQIYTPFNVNGHAMVNNAPSEAFFTATVPTANPGMAAAATAELNGIWRMWNSDYNKMYYNPTITYTPWNDSAYTDAAPATVAVTTPNYPVWWNGQAWTSPGFYAARYYTWTDSNSNGLVDEPYNAANRVDITAANAPFAGGADRDDCATPTACTYAEEIQNFANWFRYYRKRDYTTKRALSDVFQATGERVGLGTLHDNNNNVSTAIADMKVPANKTALMTALFNLSPSPTGSGNGGTPLREHLDLAGTYFENGNGLIGGSPSPIFPQAQGGQCQQNYTLLMTDGFWNGPVGSGLANIDGDNNTSFDGGSHADNRSDTLADVAMHYFERDLSGLPDEVPTITGVDENDGQHMVTFGISFGLDGALTANPADRTTAFAWPTPVADQPSTIDDLRHAAWNGRGDFLSASDPEQLIRDLNSAFERIEDRIGSASNATFDTPVLTAGTKIYFAEFNSANWRGDLKAFDIDPDTGLVASTTPAWSAAAQLDAVASAARVMLTYKNNAGIGFRWANLSTAQKNDFNNGGSSTVGEQRFDYIRGDRSKEQLNGGSFRNRQTRMGDLIHSSPVYVGTHPDTWRDDGTYSGYDTFVNTSRTPVVYVGSNDGMLHGVRVSDGQEVLAYIPGSVYSTNANEGLHYLSDPNYKHQNYVDLTPVVSDAKVGASWKTVLVGGLRGGGRGYFALDVTNPGGFTEANASSIAMWEFTNIDDGDLGYSYSRPAIVPLENNEWVAILGNGYKSDNGRAALFILKLSHTGSGWAGDYYKVPVGSAGVGNGLSSPVVVDKDGNGKADQVYAGDLQGNMWAFDLSSGPGSVTARKLFTDPSGNAITTAPTIVRHPRAQSAGPDMLLMFGTGRYLVDSDPADTSVQTFYGVWDNGNAANVGDLVEQTITTATTSSGHSSRVLSRHPVTYPGKRGWYFRLNDVSGERVVIDPLVRGFDVWLVTSIPSTAPCDNAGSGFLMSADILTGGSPRSESVDINGDGEVNAGDLFIDSDGDGVADLAADSLLTTPQDLDGDGTVDTVSDLDGDGDIDLNDLTIMLGTLNLTVDTFGSAGLSIEDVGLTGGFSLLSDTIYVLGAQGALPSTGAGGSGSGGITIVPAPAELLGRLSWEEL